MPNISNFFARTIARELQLSPEQWSEYTGDTRQNRETVLTQQRMPLQDFVTLLSNALAISRDPGLGLRFGRHSNLLALGESGLAGLAAPNLLEALRALCDFSRLQADYMTMDIKVGLKQLSFRVREHEAIGITRRTQHEVMMLTLQNILEMVLGRPFTEGTFYFSYPQPPYCDRYREAYHSPCVFDADETGVDLDRSLIDFPSPFYDPVLWEQGRSRCIALMQELNNSQSQLHSHHILMTLRSQTPPLPSLKTIAHKMHLSERTLIRRLSEEGHTYRQLQTKVLQEWAHHYLRETDLSVDAIALQLGYQDSANFRRAFRNWQGCSPSEYRAADQS
ncbi:MAG: ornithine utilization transcriptional regulator OruR [Candidatus Pelagadaptatus aseana]|uniref:AraC family transcriptional regulator n=1 Tax=Candidatus Pelagadaptatus aseana TaxID=3120508 RepID=UPI0039B31B4A